MDFKLTLKNRIDLKALRFHRRQLEIALPQFEEIQKETGGSF